ncbi:ArsR/SmtB family transcription factor [Methyloraptor flagellatus]|jgi:DNA-binding transcriptional ArsR family regulator|uniref:Metalloregulator ArsR/SmtB family transcription factor n=1 Tax=Methyloraptor flagellatus TaxID=3162530 RepID=A0AAU7XGY3_9HYPH
MPQTDVPDHDVSLDGSEASGTSHLNFELARPHIREAAEFLKALAHEHRLLMLFLLAGREYSVRELEVALDLRQPAVSQQLARLRTDGLVSTRRQGKMIYYSLASVEIRCFVVTLYRLLCRSGGGGDQTDQAG